jgi:hypothetical protein
MDFNLGVISYLPAEGSFTPLAFQLAANEDFLLMYFNEP